MINKELLQKRFNRGSATYDDYAVVQKKMAQQLLRTISFSSTEQFIILEIGCGTGYLTELLHDHFPKAEITALDISESMLAVAKEKLVSSNIRFICGDAEGFCYERKYDLIISNATFQWFNHTEKTMKKLWEAVNPEGTLSFSTFGTQTFKELHLAFNDVKQDRDDKIGPSFYTKHELQMMCERITCMNVEVKGEQYVEEFETVLEFLQSIKKIGATNSVEKDKCQSPGVIRKLISHYDQLFRQGEYIPATYEALFYTIKR